MPNRINTFTDLQASNGDCTVDFDIRLARPPAGEGGDATVSFSSKDNPLLGGSDQPGNLTADTASSEPFDCCGGSFRVQATPSAPKEWDTVSSASDLETALVPAS